METKARFALTAFFVLTFLVAAHSFANWIAGSGQSEKLKYYQLVFNSPAPGLAAGVKVLFNGLPVGRVIQVGLSPSGSSQVDALIEVGKEVPVKADTKARLDRRIPIGSVVVALTGGRSDAPDIKIDPDQFFPIIIVERSAQENFLESIRSLSALAPRVMEKMGKIFEESRGAYAVQKYEFEPFKKMLEDKSEQIGTIIEEVKDFSRSAKPIVKRFNNLVAAVDARTPHGAGRAANGAGGSMAFVDSLSASKLKAMEQFAVEANKAVLALDRFARTLARDPGDAPSGETPALAPNKKP